jgi:hypothetical protein
LRQCIVGPDCNEHAADGRGLETASGRGRGSVRGPRLRNELLTCSTAVAQIPRVLPAFADDGLGARIALSADMRWRAWLVLFPLPFAAAALGCSSPAATGAAHVEDGGVDASAPIEAGIDGAVDAGTPPGTDGAAVPGSDAGVAPDVSRPADPCAEEGGCAAGSWTDVTPASVSLTAGACGNYGTKGVQVDPLRAQDVYAEFNCQGIWKSTDYGQTWNGPINTGQNGAAVGDCAGSIAIARSPTNPAPILYESCIRGTGTGFWRSTNGGVDWTNLSVLPDGGVADAVNQQFYTPAVDPYDANHLLMSQHETDGLVQSTDGGQTWTTVILEPAMVTTGDTGGVNFIDTGDATTTRSTWLWLSAASAGTWRTSDGAATWAQVETNEHVAGSMHSEVYQPAPSTSGVVYMAGEYSASGSGVLVSTDWGQTWAHVGLDQPESIVIGTPTHLYAMFGWAIGAGQSVDPSLEVGAPPGAGTWASPGTPPTMTQGPGQAAVTYDGTNEIVFVGDYNAGLWRYVEAK